MIQEVKLRIKDIQLKQAYLKNFPALARDGIQTFEGFLSGAELENHLSHFDEIMANANIPKKREDSDRRIYGVERYDKLFITKRQKEFVADFNAKAKVFTDNINFTLAGEIKCSPGNLGSGGGWHRDSPYTNQFKTIIYLTDVCEENGPFQYIKGSHKRGSYKKVSEVLKGYNYGKMRFSDEEVGLVTKHVDGLSNLTVTGKAGDMLLVNTRGLHRGKPLTNGIRKAVTTYSFRNNIPKQFFK